MAGDRSFGSRVLLTAGTNILLGGIGLVTGTMVARLLGPERRGELAAIQTWGNLIATLSMLGLLEALVYYSAREPLRAGRYLGSALTLTLLSSLPFMAMGYLALPTLLGVQSADTVATARWYLLMVPLAALVNLPNQVVRGLNNFVAWNGLRIAPSIGWMFVIVLAWLLGRAEPRFIAACYLGALGVLVFPLIYTAKRLIPDSFQPEVRKWPSMLRYGLPCVTTSIPLVLNSRLDQMTLAAFLPAEELGNYVVAVSWAAVLSPLVSAIGAVIFPHVASRANREEQVRALSQGTRLGLLVSVVLALAVLIPTPWAILFLFGESFAAARWPALFQVIASAIAGLNSLMEEGFRGLGNPATVMWAELGGVAVTGVFMLLFVSPLGITGAALASLLGQTYVGLFLVLQASRVTRESPVALLCPTRRDVSATWIQIRALAKEIQTG